MKKVVDDVRLMIKVCDLYYNQKMGQQQITEELGISRPTVSRLLASSLEQGIVKIQVSNLDMVKHWKLEEQLKERYHLKDVMIVDSGCCESQMKEQLGDAAARYLRYQIKDGSMIGVSMGSTIHEVVSQIKENTAENVTFVPLIGGMGQLRMELHANSLAEKLSRKYEGHFIPLQAPARVSSSLVRKELMKEEGVARALQYGERVELAIVGIGYPNENSSIKATGYFKENEIESLKEREVAGEICMQFYDMDGSTAPYKNDNNVIGMELSKLQKIACSVGIAGGIEKVQAIRGAIAGRYINALITDYDCAKALLEQGEARNETAKEA